MLPAHAIQSEKQEAALDIKNFKEPTQTRQMRLDVQNSPDENY